MARRRFSPALADLRQDIAGVIPVELVKAWTDSDQSRATQERLLEPYRADGTVVCSDAAGISKLSKQRPFLEVLRLVEFPKETIHAYGVGSGGQAIGTWAADNTEMFYPASVDPLRVVEAMATAQTALAADGGIQAGMAAHRGTFYTIGGGLFGEEADFVEHVAEDHTRGGEIVLTDSLRALAEGRWPTRVAPYPESALEEPVFLFDYAGLALNGQRAHGTVYPSPFKPEVGSFLKRTDATEKETTLFLEPYTRDGFVIFLKVRHRTSEFLLDRLADWAVAATVAHTVADEHAVETVKTNGDIGIFLTPDADVARAFAFALRQALKTANFTCNIGISRGEAYVFPLPDGGHEIAGGPVNMASKISEEMTDHPGVICIQDATDGEPFCVTFSGVELKGGKF